MAGSDGNGTVSATHAWGTLGTFTVRLTIADDDTGSGSREATLTVLDGPGAVCGLVRPIKQLGGDSTLSHLVKPRLKQLLGQIELACGLLNQGQYASALDEIARAVATIEAIIEAGGLAPAHLAALQQWEHRLVLTARWISVRLAGSATAARAQGDARAPTEVRRLSPQE